MLQHRLLWTLTLIEPRFLINFWIAFFLLLLESLRLFRSARFSSIHQVSLFPLRGKECKLDYETPLKYMKYRIIQQKGPQNIDFKSYNGLRVQIDLEVQVQEVRPQISVAK